MTGTLFVPAVGRSVVFRVDLTVNQIKDNIVGTDFVPARFFAAVLAGDFPALEQEECCCFTDMCNAVELILCDDLGVIPSDGFIVFKFFIHADNHLDFDLA